jgi:hypothetical protein
MTVGVRSTWKLQHDVASLFPASNGTLSITPSGQELRRHARDDWNRRHPLLRVLLWGGLYVAATMIVLGTVGGVVAGAWQMLPMLAYGIPALFVFGLILVLVVSARNRKASDAFFTHYGGGRGLEVADVGAELLGIDIPLFALGDKRTVLRGVRGPVLDSRGIIAHYRYTDVSRDADGNTSETHYPFTVVALPLPDVVADRFPGVYMRTRVLGSGWFAGFGPHRSVQLDSSQLHDTYDLRVADEQDDIALFELMSTTFIQWLVDLPCIDDERVQFEKRGSYLVVFMRSHPEEAELLDALVDAAAVIYQRYCDEHM